MIGNFLNPNQILEEVGISKGSVVVDFGAGSGHYTFTSARIVGADGKVYALEVQKELVEKLKTEAEKMHYINVSPIWCNVEKVHGTKLSDNMADLAIVSNVFFQIEDRQNFVKEIWRIVKNSGRVLLIDWSDSFGGLGPEPNAVIREEEAKVFFEKNGFKFSRKINAGAHHYGIIFTKS